MMKWSVIEQLLERFWEGNTSVAEERQLKNAFLREDVPSNLVAAKTYFLYLENQQKEKFPRKEMNPSQFERLDSKKTSLFTLPKLFAYAAGLIILMSSMYFIKEEAFSTKGYEALSVKEIQIAQKYMLFLADNMESTVTYSSRKLDNIQLLNKGTNTVQTYESTYKRQFNKLSPMEHFDQSFIRLKYLKTFENSKIKL